MVCTGKLTSEKACTACAALHKQELDLYGCTDFEQDTGVACKHATCVAGLGQFSCLTGNKATCEQCFAANKPALKNDDCGSDSVAKLCSVED